MHLHDVRNQPGQVTPGLAELHALCDAQAAAQPAKFDSTAFIIAFENGDIESNDELIDGFQHLIDSGLVWNLQGSYGRMARSLINAGLCHD